MSEIILHMYFSTGQISLFFYFMAIVARVCDDKLLSRRLAGFICASSVHSVTKLLSQCVRFTIVQVMGALIVPHRYLK